MRDHIVKQASTAFGSSRAFKNQARFPHRVAERVALLFDGLQGMCDIVKSFQNDIVEPAVRKLVATQESLEARVLFLYFLKELLPRLESHHRGRILGLHHALTDATVQYAMWSGVMSEQRAARDTMIEREALERYVVVSARAYTLRGGKPTVRRVTATTTTTLWSPSRWPTVL